MLCLSCDEIFDVGKKCPKCGGRLSRRRRDVLAWEAKRQHVRIDAWCKEGVIGDLVAERLHDALGVHAPPPSAPIARESSVERAADRMTSGASVFFDDVRVRWGKLTRAIESETEPPPPREDMPIVGVGLEALAELDETPEGESPATPFGALQVFWFIGTVLVLAGSVMGVREAWRSLEGVWRPVVIASAFFAYHVLFVGLARLLVKRSRVTARVLTGVAAGLLPVVFVAAAVAIGQRASIGVPFAALLGLASAASLLHAGKVADRAATGVALAGGLVPALVIELVAGRAELPPSPRGLSVLASLVPVLVLATRARSAPRGSSLVGVLAATYGALAVAILGVFGGPGAEPLSFDTGEVASPALVGFLALFAACAWWTSTGPAVAARLGRFALVPLLLAHAMLVGTSIASIVLALDAPQAAVMFVRFVPIGVLVLTTGVLAIDQRVRPGTLHVLPLIAGFATLLTARDVLSERPASSWLAACAIVPAAYFTASALLRDRRRRAIMATWGIVLGLFLTFLTCVLEAVARRDADDGHPYLVTLVVAAALAVTAHAGARRTRPSLHVAGALFALFAVLAWRLPLGAILPNALWSTIGVSAVYGVVALLYVPEADDDRRPLDDVSLLFALGALGVAVLRPVPELTAPLGALAALFFVRALRDRTALVVIPGAFAATLAIYTFLPAGTAVLGFGAGACALVAAFRGPSTEKRGRALYGLVPLPLPNLLDGFALASLILALCTLASALSWLGLPVKDELARSLVLCGLAGVLVTGLAAFATRAFTLLHARGSVVTLSLIAPVIGLTAVSYRIGRPLPPDVVGFRLSFVLFAVWLLARGAAKAGPRIARALERPSDGDRYHHVVHAGVLALSLLLFVDAVLVGAPTLERALAVTPPTLLLGSALGLFLLHRSYRREPFLHLAVYLATGASALAVAQGSLYGHHLVMLDRWTSLDPVATDLHARASLGAGGAMFAIAALMVLFTRVRRLETDVRGLAMPLVVMSAVLAIGLTVRPALPAAIAFAIVGLVAAAAASPSYRAIPLVLAAPLVVRACDAPWASQAYAGLALAAVLVSLRRARGRSQLVAFAYGLLAAGAAFDAVTFAILGVAMSAAALTWRGGMARILSVAPALLFALAAVASNRPLALSLAVAMTISHALAFVMRDRDDLSWGFAVGRDLGLLATGIAMLLFGKDEPALYGLMACGLALAASVHTITWRGTARHVAIVEALVVAFYAYATRTMRPSPAVDALVGLFYGFSLLGVTVLARRSGITNVAVATRRFLAALPIFLFFVTGAELPAGMALGASVLYGAIAFAERSRIFGSLAAIAANLALVAFAVAQGLDGIEVYVGPVGILVTALSQIFAPKLSPPARSVLRVLGGGLLYLPAGLKLTLQLGEAQDGTYSVVFGAVCLLGAVAGLALRVRAYLALGTLFLVLDVLANLVHAGLRDHRVGFVLLSVSGLAILGGMIGITLLRDRAWAAAARLRFALRAWD